MHHPAQGQHEIALLAQTVGEVRNSLRAAYLQHPGWEQRLRAWGCSYPRWAILHALAEEHERQSWGEESGGGAEGGVWAGRRRERAAQLYSDALASPALAGMPPHAFSAAFNRTAAAIRRLRGGSYAARRREPALFLDAAAAAAAAERQCNATKVEHDRWRGNRASVRAFARAAPSFAPRSRRRPSPTTKTVAPAAGRSGTQNGGGGVAPAGDFSEELRRRWPGFSPVGAGEALHRRRHTDLRAALRAADRGAGAGGRGAGWWAAFLSACSPPPAMAPPAGAGGPGGLAGLCPEGSRFVPEEQLDVMKVREKSVCVCVCLCACLCV
jgi:hypothetical protein